MSKKLTISKAEATAFTIDGIGVDLWWPAGTSGAYDKAVSTCMLLQKVPEMIEALKKVRLSIGMIEHNWNYSERSFMPDVIKILKELKS